MVEKNSKEGYNFETRENDEKFEFQCPSVKIYWNTVTFIHLRIAWGCFVL